MKEYVQKLIAERGLQLSLIFILAIVTINVILVIYYRQVIINSSESSKQVETIREKLSQSDFYIFQADVGVRGFLLMPTQKFLDPYTAASANFKDNLDALNESLEANGFDMNLMTAGRVALEQYMLDLQLIVDLKKAGRDDEANELFYEDRGYTAWRRYAPSINAAKAFAEELDQQNEEAYKSSINSILLILIIQIILATPILIMAYRKIVKDDKFRVRLFHHIDQSNRNFLFDDGQELEVNDEDSIINNLVGNLKKAASFINNITKGNFSIHWEGMEGKIVEMNKESIAGELVMMRDQMQKAKKEDDIRIWTNEGLSKFADLIRRYQNNLGQLSDDLISHIVEYLNAQQGGLFFLNDDSEDDRHLELVGCYAYQRKKFQEKRIELGQGMVGQCFLEGETTHLSNIPDNYVSITSGLGDTNPNTLLIVPLRMNEVIVGVIEIASLKPFEKYQIDFLERLAETIASAITSVKTNEKTQGLLEQSQQQAEEMRAQEEEMRQNMEELQATQEQMHRKNEEVENLLQQASENEESMKLQMEALAELQEEADHSKEKIQKEAEDFKQMLMEILNEVPQKIFLKDAEGKIFIANQKVADAHGMPLSELIGKSDYDFVDKDTADEWRKQELEIMKKGEEKYVFEDIIGGKKVMRESMKKVFNIKPLNQTGLLGIQTEL